MIYKLANSISYNNSEDLFQVGVIGLINAYKKFDNKYNTKFSTYAYPYILGEMKKYVRENKGIKISRDLIYLSNRLDKLIYLLCQKYKRMPTSKELSDILEVDEWKVIEALNIKNKIKSLDEPVKTEGNPVYIKDIIPSNNDEFDKSEISEMFSLLNNEEKSLLYERFFNDRSQSETAKIIGYSQAKVSREEEKILKKLKNYYTNT